MAIYNLFSRRRKKELGEYPDVYQYEKLTDTLKIQIVHILRELLGEGYDRYHDSYQVYEKIEKVILKEHGLISITNGGEYSSDRLFNYLLRSPLNTSMDVIELCMNAARSINRRVFEKFADEVNTRFQEAGVGYKYEEGQFMRIDSEMVHSEIVKPALKLLTAKHFSGAQEEFLTAHAHYRANNYKECLNDCLKAFESTMKGICVRRGWETEPKATAKTLLDLLFAKKLIPDIMVSHFSGLRSTLESGVPTARNKMAGHGQGATPIAVPLSIATYVLHLTATNIVFLARLDAEKP